MFSYFYQWIQNITFYMVIVTAVIQIIPNNSYKKYVRFFTGLILIVMLTDSIMKVVGISNTFFEMYDNVQYKQTIREIEETTKFLEGVSLEDVEADEIRVEEIQIGE